MESLPIRHSPTAELNHSKNIVGTFRLPSSAAAAAMGFYYHTITLPKPLTFFFSILTSAAALLFPPLRLRNHPPLSAAEQQYSDSSSRDYIKERIPVLRYGDFLRRRGMVESQSSEADGEREKACSICLEGVKWRDEIREPCICGHVFHRACLDGWMDVGKVNCPLCRAMLLPPKTNLVLSAV